MNVERVLHIIAWILRAVLFIAAIEAFLKAQYDVLFVIVLALVLTFFSVFMKAKYQVELPEEFNFLVILFIYTTLILGEVNGYYVKFWWWDIVMHVTSSIALGILGFLLLFMLYQGKKVTAHPGLIAFFTFCFVLAMGAIWEIAEFTIDNTIENSVKGFPMQPNLLDTMRDLIIDGISAIVVSLFGYHYLKGKTFLFRNLIERFSKKNPKLFR